MTDHFCPHCGCLILIPVLFRARIKQRIYDYIRRHPGCIAREIMSWVYADDPSGGPDSNALSAHLVQMKPILRANGLRITCHRGPNATYRVEKLMEEKGYADATTTLTPVLR